MRLSAQAPSASSQAISTPAKRAAITHQFKQDPPARAAVILAAAVRNAVRVHQGLATQDSSAQVRAPIPRTISCHRIRAVSWLGWRSGELWNQRSAAAGSPCRARQAASCRVPRSDRSYARRSDGALGGSRVPTARQDSGRGPPSQVPRDRDNLVFRARAWLSSHTRRAKWA
jgi:hypothetical protein